MKPTVSSAPHTKITRRVVAPFTDGYRVGILRVAEVGGFLVVSFTLTSLADVVGQRSAKRRPARQARTLPPSPPTRSDAPPLRWN